MVRRNNDAHLQNYINLNIFDLTDAEIDYVNQVVLRGDQSVQGTLEAESDYRRMEHRTRRRGEVLHGNNASRPHPEQLTLLPGLL